MAQHPPFFRWGLACAAECDGRALDRILPVLSVARKGVAELGASGFGMRLQQLLYFHAATASRYFKKNKPAIVYRPLQWTTMKHAS